MPRMSQHGLEEGDSLGTRCRKKSQAQAHRCGQQKGPHLQPPEEGFTSEAPSLSLYLRYNCLVQEKGMTHLPMYKYDVIQIKYGMTERLNFYSFTFY